MAFETVKIKKKTGAQIIELPETHHIDDDKVYLKKVGNSIFVIPFKKPWESLFGSLDQFTSDFMEERNQPDKQERELFE